MIIRNFNKENQLPKVIHWIINMFHCISMDENNGNTVATINQREASFIAHTRALARQISYYFSWEHCGNDCNWFFNCKSSSWEQDHTLLKINVLVFYKLQ